MEWSKEAATAIKKVPFFVRKRVKARVEEEAARQGDNVVTLKHVKACQQRFLNKMEEEVKGYQVETCFGPSGCPNRAVETEGLADKLQALLDQKGLKDFLKTVVGGPLKLHHEFRVSISDCPNACSRPQIADVGLIGALRPVVSDESCSHCQACVDACKESAIELTEDGPIIDFDKCLYCGSCIRECPTATLAEGESGYRILVGGKLGRHPRLAQDLGKIFHEDSIPSVLSRIVDLYKAHCKRGERLGAIIENKGIETFAREIKNPNLLI